MVDAARQMLDELMGRNRNLHPSEAGQKLNWDDQDFCQYHIVKFCPHDLFINTRADLGPCNQIHDDEAKRLYAEARPSARKRNYEDEFLRFCNVMLNDVDRKIQKGKQRLLLMKRDQPPHTVSKFQEQLNNLNARIQKLVSEAEEAGIRGDVDQAQDLMTLCEQLKDERDALVSQHDSVNATKLNEIKSPTDPAGTNITVPNKDDNKPTIAEDGGMEKKLTISGWPIDHSEKQMEVCEVCGAFLIVGDAQQRIEDHLMGKQHLGYDRLRKAVEEIHERRKTRDDDEYRRRDDRSTSYSGDRRRDRDYRDRSDRDRGDRDRDYRGRSRDNDRYRHRSSHSSRSSRHHRRSRSRSSSRSRSRSRY